MNALRLTLFAALSLLLGCGGPLASGELRESELCHDLPPLAVEPAPAAASGDLAFVSEVDVPDEVAALQDGSDLSVEIVRVELSADGVPDLSFIDAAHLSRLESGDADAPATLLADYQRKEPLPRSVTLVPPKPDDLSPALAQDPLWLKTQLTGTLPVHPWSLNVRVCYRARASFEWAP